MTLALERDYLTVGHAPSASAPLTVSRVVQLMLVAQLLGTITDLSTISSAADEGFDTARWAMLLPGLAFTYFLVFTSRPLLGWITRGPALLFTIWLAWALIGTGWSIDARRTAIQLLNATSLFVFSFWYVRVVGLNRYAQLFCLTSLGVILAGLLLDYGPWTVEPLAISGLERLVELDAPRRVFGITSGTNQLSMLGALTVIVATAIVPVDRQRRALQVASLTAGTAAIVLSGSRTVMVGILIAAMVRFGWKATARTRIRAFSGGIGLTLTVVGLINLLSVETAFGTKRSFESLNGREDVWGYAWELVARSPLTGIGMTASRISWSQALIEARTEFFAADSHNMVFEVLIGTGFVGLAIFAASLLWATRRAFLSVDTTVAALLTLILFASMTEALVSSATIIYSMIGVSLGAVTIDRPQTPMAGV
jgi:O-antigen ligase